MKPYHLAKALYEKHVPKDKFEDRLANYFVIPGGCVISTPTCFAMGTAMDYDGKHAWYVDTAVGKLGDLIKLMPFQLPYIALARGAKDKTAKLKIYEAQRLLRRVKP